MEALKMHSDAACKKVLSIKSIAAYILKDCVKEFQNSTLDEIIQLLDKENPSGSIRNMNSEDLSKPDAKIVYDVLSKVVCPNEKELIFNLEPQGKIDSEGKLLFRVSYVSSRLLVWQKNNPDGFQNSEFEKIKRCVSIWIVLDPPKSMKGSQVNTNETRFQVNKGRFPIPSHVQDLQEAIVICLTDEIDVSDKSALMMLSVLFNDRMSIQDRVLCLRKHYGILMTEEEENEVESMSETWAGFYGRGVRYGVEQGIEQGKVLGIEQGKVLGIEQGKLQVASEMLMIGMDEELIIKLTGLSINEINKLKS